MTKQIWLDENRNVVAEDKATILIENEYDAKGKLVKSVTMKRVDDSGKEESKN